MSDTSFVYVTYIRTTPERLWQAPTTREFLSQYWAQGPAGVDPVVGAPGDRPATRLGLTARPGPARPSRGPPAGPVTCGPAWPGPGTTVTVKRTGLYKAGVRPV